jgi:prepilin-type N-terminal cleavage/methylation domain-containing protein
MTLHFLPCSVGRRSCRAFTLIEMIGVLAIIAVLAAVLVPALLKETDQVMVNQETATLQSFATGLQNNILRTRTIPSETNWFSVVATEYGLDTNDVATNFLHQARFFVIDKRDWFANVPSGAAYVQSSSGTTNPPVNARLMILSVLGNTSLPSGMASGRPNASDFSATWDAAPGTIPSNSPAWSGWHGNGSDLLIQRINLGPLFNHLVLNNTDNTNAPYSIDDFAVTNLPSTNQLDAYFLTGTVFKLYLANTNLEASQVLSQDSSWWFTEGVWRNSSVPAGSTFGGMEPIVQTFYADNPHNSITPAKIYYDMTNYMGRYVQNHYSSFPSAISLYTDITSLIAP